MPVISRETIGICKTRFLRVVKYETKQSLFTIELPVFVQEALGQTKVSGKTREEAERAFNELCRQYEQSIKKTRKVIAYLVMINGEVERKFGDQVYTKTIKDFSFCDATAIGMGYEVLTETEINGHKTYATLDGHRFDVRGDYKLIPWSEKAEAFFSRAQTGLHELIRRIDIFFADEDKVIEHITSSSNNLLSFKEEA